MTADPVAALATLGAARSRLQVRLTENTDAARRAAVDAHRGGMAVAQIARLLGVTRATAYKWLDDADSGA